MSSPSRTSANQVIAILSGGGDYDVDAAPDINPYIETASAIVDMVVECAARKMRTVTSTQLELMERWLAAWAYACSDKPYTQKMTLRSSGVMSGQTGMHLEANLYGQTALMLDSTGCLNNINNQSRAYAFWGGKPWSEALPWWMRNGEPPTSG